MWWTLLIFGITFTVFTLVILSLAFATSGREDSLLRNDRLSSISVWQSVLARFDFVKILNLQLVQAQVDWSVGRLTFSVLLSGALVLAVLWHLRWIPLWADIAGAWLAALAPYGYLLSRRSRRLDAFASQFPDALDSVNRAMRAGHPLVSALDSVAQESESPLDAELRKVCVEMKLGLPMARALENLRDRVPLPEVELFGAAVQLHGRTGGRLTDVMASLAESMREAKALRNEVRAIAAHGKITGFVLTVLPIGIGIMMAFVSPTYIGVLLAHPYANHLIAAAVFCLIAAHFVIRKIVDIRA